MSFSDRAGITSQKSVLQTESMDSDLRNGLWQACIESYNQIAQLAAKSKTSIFPAIVEVCADYMYAGTKHLTCYTLMLHRGRTSYVGPLYLSDPVAPIPKETIGFSFLSESIAN
jgi:hypothetical protein